jgi:2OG-Fe(II) oxygenase superfamily
LNCAGGTGLRFFKVRGVSFPVAAMSDILDLLHPSVLAAAEDLRERFARGRPLRHVVIDRFLAPLFCERLITDFPAFEERNATNELGRLGRKAVVSALPGISSSYADFDRLMRSKAFRARLEEVTAIDQLLYDRDYAGGGTHENLDGQDLDWHVDFNYHPRRPLHRRLNLLLFLNPEWKEEWGGCLEFHNDPWHPEANPDTRPVLPIANTCVIFETTEASWHGFSRIRLPQDGHYRSRRSIAVYFYTKKRPAAETAPPHGTIYAPRGLPLELTPGYTLRAVDLEELDMLLSRRDHQIRYLYERELALSRTLAGIYRSPSFRLGHSLTWPLRRLLRNQR